MPGPILRNHVVKFFGTPDETEGSVNEPREREEHALKFNEKWIYHEPVHDPAEAFERAIYWHRYDYVGTMIRKSRDSQWEKDDELPQALTKCADRPA